MNRTHRSALLLMVGLASLAFFSFPVARLTADDDKARDERLRAFAKLERGMTPERVRQLVGRPNRIARQIFYHRYREQWLYDAPASIRLTFDCPRGQKPELLAIPRRAE